MKRLNGARNDFMTEVVKMFRLMSRGRIWSKYTVILLKLYLIIAKREGVRPMKRKRGTLMRSSYCLRYGQCSNLSIVVIATSESKIF